MKFFNFFVLAITIALVNSMAIKDEFYQRLKSLEENVFIKKHNIDFHPSFNGFNGLNDVISKLKNFGGMNAATPTALEYMKTSDDVYVTTHKNYYSFRGHHNKKALIFYPGALVDERAYGEICNKLARNGIDCYLFKMPLRLAIYGFNKGDEILKDYKDQYKEIYVGGHSMGGAASSIFAFLHKKDIKGIALLASFSILPLPKDMKAVSVIATNDKVLKWDMYDKLLNNLPKGYSEVTIEGGNHGQFGDYGEQRNDGKATISVEKQHQLAIDAILKTFN